MYKTIFKNVNMIVNRTPCFILMLFVILLLSNCNNNTHNTAMSSLTGDSVSKSDSSLTSNASQTRTVLAAGNHADPAQEIEGTYVVINEPDAADQCNMTITIEQVGKSYMYKFLSDTRALSGKLSVVANQEKDGYNITFEGIEWSECEGALDDNGEPKAEEALPLPVGITGVIKDKQITIQNYGNSMNYYVQLEDCSNKYILLQKQ